MNADAPFILRHRPGHHLDPRDPVRCRGTPVASHAIELRQIYPANGWVEHDPEEIWQATLACCRAGAEGRDARRRRRDRHHQPARDHGDLGPGTGAPLHNAIVWQDRRTAERCRALKAQKWEAEDRGQDRLAARSLFLRRPSWNGCWIMFRVRGRARKKGEIAFGTIDSWLIWKLTGGQVHATDVTNASRTMLLNLKTLRLGRRAARSCSACRAAIAARGARQRRRFRHDAKPMLLGAPIPILGVAGDQQAASFGQACFKPGDVKSTYGTGCFALVNTGNKCCRARGTGCWRQRLSLGRKSAMPSKAASSSPARWCSGCATRSA